MQVLGAASGHATEALGAMNTVRAFVAEERVWKKYVALCGDPEDAAQGVGPGALASIFRGGRENKGHIVLIPRMTPFGYSNHHYC